MEFYPFNTKWGNVEHIGFIPGTYDGGNCALISYCKHIDDGGWVEPFADITVNIEPLPAPYLAAIDTNNLGEEIIDFLVENGFAQETGEYLTSGFCTYPIVEFDHEWLDGLCDS